MTEEEKKLPIKWKGSGRVPGMEVPDVRDLYELWQHAEELPPLGKPREKCILRQRDAWALENPEPCPNCGGTDVEDTKWENIPSSLQGGEVVRKTVYSSYCKKCKKRYEWNPYSFGYGYNKKGFKFE